MLKMFKNFFKEEEGNIIEYIIVLAVIAIVIAALFPGLRSKIMDWFNNMIGNVDGGLGGTTCSGTETYQYAANPSGLDDTAKNWTVLVKDTATGEYDFTGLSDEQRMTATCR